MVSLIQYDKKVKTRMPAFAMITYRLLSTRTKPLSMVLYMRMTLNIENGNHLTFNHSTFGLKDIEISPCLFLNNTNVSFISVPT